MKQALHVIHFLAEFKRWTAKVPRITAFIFMAMLSQPLPAQVAGGNVLAVDGVDDYVDVPELTYATDQPITIEFWNYVPTNAVQQGSVFNIGGTDFTDNIQSHVPWTDNALYWDYGTTGDAGGRISVDYTPYLDHWTHVALVSAGTTGSFKAIYLNGVLVASENSSDGPNTNKSGLTIGKNQWLFHRGKLDEFRVWNTIRTQQQIQDNMETALIGTEAGLKAVFHFDENAGSTTITDGSPNGYSGTVMGGATLVPADNQVDTDPPFVEEIVRFNPAEEITDATSVTFRVTFNEPVTGVDDLDFTPMLNGNLGIDFISVGAISPSEYDVTVQLQGEGVIGLSVQMASIADLAGNNYNSIFLAGETYTIDRPTAPLAGLIALQGAFTPIEGGTSVDEIETNDASSADISLGFAFFFNGIEYSTVRASSNGFLTFNTFFPANEADPFPNNNLTMNTINPLIAPYWDDLSGEGGQASYVVSGDAPNRIFTFEWLNWRANQYALAANISFQVKLYEGTNHIEFIYREESGELSFPSASIGLSFQGFNSFFSLNNTSQNPVASPDVEVSTIDTRPATGQIYKFVSPAPIFSSTAPVSNATVTNTKISYELSEDIASGTVTWTRVAGSADPASPHVQPLTGIELTAGIHQNITLINSPALVTGAVYTISFNGVNADSLAAQEVVNENITFDKTLTRAYNSPLFQNAGVTGIRSVLPLNDAEERMMIAGTLVSSDTYPQYVARLYADGSLDATFIQGAGPDGAVNAMVLQEGKLIIAGNFTHYNGTTCGRIVRLNEDGSVDNTFVPGAGANGKINSVLLLNDGKILIGGDFSNYDDNIVAGLARINADGSYDASFNYPVGENFQAITFLLQQQDGRIIMSGVIPPVEGESSGYQSVVSRINEDGSPDPSFAVAIFTSSPEGAPIHIMKLQSDGKVVVGGEFFQCNINPRQSLARLNTDGTVDDSFNIGTALDGIVHTMLLQDDGKILIGGDFTAYGELERNRIALLLPDGSLDLSFIPDSGADDGIFAIVSNLDNNLLVAGDFTHFNNEVRNGITLVDTSFPYVVSSNRIAGIGELTNNNAVTFQVLFSEVVDGVDAADFNLVTTGITTGNITVTKLFGGLAYNVRVNAIAGSGTIRLDVTEATLSDLAGNAYNAVFQEGQSYVVDQSEPVFSNTSPASDAATSTTQVSYFLSETLASGSITWTRTGGTEDANSPHVMPLAGEELMSGDHNNLTLAINPMPVDGAIYAVSFSGTDLAGNSAQVTRTNVVYDVSPPVFSEISPASNGVISNTRVSYFLSETLASGSITWTRTGGAEDANSPHMESLAAEELLGGDHNDITITNAPSLVSGAIYSISFVGTDAAGNSSVITIQSDIVYDNIAPVFSGIIPASNSIISNTRVSYFLSETLASGSITWTRTGGTEDANSPHVELLIGKELKGGDHNDITLANSPELVIGAIYSVAISGTDDAGNTSIPVTLTNITFGIIKADQVITFTAIEDKTLGDSSFDVTATSSSGLPVTLTTASEKITIADGKITMQSAGRASVVATQSGNENYKAAAPVEKTFCIRPMKPVITYSFEDAGHPVLTSSSEQGNQWYLDGSPIEGATGSTHAVTARGTYKVQVKADDCISDFSGNFVVLITALAENPGEKIALYPNPAIDAIMVSGTTAGAEFGLVDVTGKLFSAKVIQHDQYVTVDVSNLTPGMYLLHVTEHGKVKRTKFIKK